MVIVTAMPVLITRVPILKLFLPRNLAVILRNIFFTTRHVFSRMFKDEQVFFSTVEDKKPSWYFLII